MIAPPRWSSEQLSIDIQRARDLFRIERMQEPLEAYLKAFDEYRAVVEELLATSDDLTKIYERATEALTNPRLLEAFRYLTGPRFQPTISRP
jgi:hypothetical protein